MTRGSEFSHIEGNTPRMVDISDKSITHRYAVARAVMEMPKELIARFSAGDASSKKGPIFHTAIIAGTMAVKNTPHLIPLCHGINIEDVKFHMETVAPELLHIMCEVKSMGRTGVEMEALTGASIAALTIYDMCKSITLEMKIVEIKLIKKTGGKHGQFSTTT